MLTDSSSEDDELLLLSRQQEDELNKILSTIDYQDSSETEGPLAMNSPRSSPSLHSLAGFLLLIQSF